MIHRGRPEINNNGTNNTIVSLECNILSKREQLTVILEASFCEDHSSASLSIILFMFSTLVSEFTRLSLTSIVKLLTYLGGRLRGEPASSVSSVSL